MSTETNAISEFDVCAIRVFGSRSSLGSEPRQSPPQSPIRLESYPATNEETIVTLGDVDPSYVRANRISRAIGMVALAGLGSVTEPEKSEYLIDEMLAGDATTGSWAVEDFNWYVSVAIIRHVSSKPTPSNANRYFWLWPYSALEMEREFQSYAKDHLDLITTYLTTTIERMFFEERVLDDRVFFSASGREMFGPPSFRAFTPDRLIRSGGALDFEETESLLRRVAHAPQQKHDWLNRVKRWHLAALVEPDSFKRFLWSFLALEIMIQKLSPQLRTDVVRRLRLVSTTDDAQLPYPAPERIVWDIERMPLEAKFAILAAALRPDSASDDIALFSRVKKVRDAMSHGTISPKDDLRVHDIATLLESYLKAAVDRHL